MARRVLVLILAAGCGAPTAGPTRPGPTPVEVEGLHNVYRLSDRLYSGGGPEGDAGFAALQTLGVKTVVSVDGAAPDAATAGRYGLRYVHVPVGYDGIPREKAWRIAKAVAGPAGAGVRPLSPRQASRPGGGRVRPAGAGPELHAATTRRHG